MEGSAGLPRTWAPGCCGGIAARLLVLRQSFPRKQQQLAQQNKMHAGGLSQEPPGNQSCSSLGEKTGDNGLCCFLPQREQRKSPQALLMTHCCFEFPSPCCLDTQLMPSPATPSRSLQKTAPGPHHPCVQQDQPLGLATPGPRTAPAPAAVTRTELCLTCSFPFFPVFSCTVTIPEAQRSLTLAVLICF